MPEQMIGRAQSPQQPYSCLNVTSDAFKVASAAFVRLTDTRASAEQVGAAESVNSCLRRKDQGVRGVWGG